MNTKQKLITLFGCLLLFTACRDEYFPVIKNPDKEIMVVEGYIDGGQETTITLSRVIGFGNVTPDEKFISDAIVHVEDEDGRLYPLYYSYNGMYRAMYFYNPTKKYRVIIHTKDQKEYASQFVSYKTSPPMGPLTYKAKPEGMQFFLNTGDNTGNTVYYRWKYEETWQFRSFYKTQFQYDSELKEVVWLKDSIYNCWQTDKSTQILLGSSEHLSEDVIRDFPLLFIKNGSEKLSYIYSIHVKQYALDSAGYTFYRLLKKNTEETGGIFDPQPGNLKGNVMNVHDPNELVIGYIGAGRSRESRQFFTIPWDFQLPCTELIPVPADKQSLENNFSEGSLWPIDGDGEIWIAAPTNCVDCRTRGTNRKPAFWP